MVKAGIVGGTGYTGIELLRLLAQHPGVEVTAITSRSEAGKPVAEVFPSLLGTYHQNFSSPDGDVLAGCDVVFFATPNGIAMQSAPRLLESGTRVIDLAADFRIRDEQVWRRWYGMEHACPQLLAEAVYGLPEQNRERIRTARLLANPGCYPTAVSLGLLPLLESGRFDKGSIIADAKSGVSGAGKKTDTAYLLAEASENMNPYAVQGHRHQPEMEQILSQAAGEPVSLMFVPHLTPMIRGMLATIYVRTELQEQEIRDMYTERYREEPFVELLSASAVPHTKSVRGSNRCQIALKKSGKMLIVMSVIDNLTKGAAGQAVQNMNLMFHLPETGGLGQVGLTP